MSFTPPLPGRTLYCISPPALASLPHSPNPSPACPHAPRTAFLAAPNAAPEFARFSRTPAWRARVACTYLPCLFCMRFTTNMDVSRKRSEQLAMH